MTKFIHDTLPQSIYDSFNDFIFSQDRKLFGKLASKIFFTDITKYVPGNIIELGVFKGSGILAWLKANELHSVNSKNVYGFDIFNQVKLVEGIGTQDANLMASLFKDRNFESNGYESVLINIAENAGFNNLRLVVGNVFDTLPIFLEKNPGFRASIINFDLDTYEPTIFCLNQLYDRLVIGGVLIFDEYNINEWTESQAVDEFISQKKLKLISTAYSSPSAYIVKS